MLPHCPVCGCGTLIPIASSNSLYVVVNQEQGLVEEVLAYSCEAAGHIIMTAAEGTPSMRATPPVEPNGAILNSWKEIAAYTGRGVRTVQRWEEHFGLPIHRPKGEERSSVLAFREELDAWLRETPVRARPVLRKTA